MAPTFLGAALSGEAFHRLEVQDVTEFDSVDALFLLDGGRREGKKRREKPPWERRVFWGRTRLAVPNSFNCSY
jgi:hypothetical protein